MSVSPAESVPLEGLHALFEEGKTMWARAVEKAQELRGRLDQLLADVEGRQFWEVWIPDIDPALIRSFKVELDKLMGTADEQVDRISHPEQTDLAYEAVPPEPKQPRTTRNWWEPRDYSHPGAPHDLYGPADPAALDCLPDEDEKAGADGGPGASRSRLRHLVTDFSLYEGGARMTDSRRLPFIGAFSNVSVADWDFPAISQAATPIYARMHNTWQLVDSAMKYMAGFGERDDALLILAGTDRLLLRDIFHADMVDQAAGIKRVFVDDVNADYERHMSALRHEIGLRPWRIPDFWITLPTIDISDPGWENPASTYYPAAFPGTDSTVPLVPLTSVTHASVGSERALIGHGVPEVPDYDPADPTRNDQPYPWSTMAGESYTQALHIYADASTKVSEVCYTTVFALRTLRVTWLDYAWSLITAVASFYIYSFTLWQLLVDLVALVVRTLVKVAKAGVITATAVILEIATGGAATPVAATLIAQQTLNVWGVVGDVFVTLSSLATRLANGTFTYITATGTWVKNSSAFFGASEQFSTQLTGEILRLQRPQYLWPGGDYGDQDFTRREEPLVVCQVPAANVEWWNMAGAEVLDSARPRPRLPYVIDDPLRPGEYLIDGVWHPVTADPWAGAPENEDPVSGRRVYQERSDEGVGRMRELYQDFREATRPSDPAVGRP